MNSLSHAIYYFLTVIIWGTTWFVITFQLREASPEISIFYRFAIASIFLFSYCKIKNIPIFFTLKDHGFLCLLGFCMFSVHMIFIYTASQYLVSGLVSILFSLVSVFNICNNFIFYRKRPEPSVLLGSLVGFLGVFVFFWHEIMTFSLKSKMLLGVGMALAGTLLFSFGNLISKRNQDQKIALIPSTAVAMGYGSIILFLYCLLNQSSFVFPISFSYWASLLYLAIPGSIIAFLCYLRLIKDMGPERAGYATILFPIIALLVSFFFEDYHLSAKDLFGIALALTGNLLIMYKKKTKVQMISK